MKTATRILIRKKQYPVLYDYLDRYARQAKLLYNACLFIIRQVFFGWKKEARTYHEESVYEQVQKTAEVYEGLQLKSGVLGYNKLDKILRANRNPDYFSGLPMQTAEAVARQAAQNFKSWLNSLKQYKKDPSGYTGRPRIPKYLKSDFATFKITNQDAVLKSVADGKGNVIPDCSRLKLPGMPAEDQPVLHGVSAVGRLKEVSVKPYYDCYILTLIIEDGAAPFYPDLPNMAGIDLGTDNIAAIACTDCSSVVYKGGAVLSANRWFAKTRGDAVSAITRGCRPGDKKAESAHLTRLSLKHDCQSRDMMHQYSHSIIVWCLKHRVGTIVIGRNTGWKQGANMGVINNQKFVMVPHHELIMLIEYKAMKAGIVVIEQEESYTSKADLTANDFMPVYGHEKGKSKFSGRRISRGQYRIHDGLVLNADCHGAANILRKAFPDAWKNVGDFRFLMSPESMSWKRVMLAKS